MGAWADAKRARGKARRALIAQRAKDVVESYIAGETREVIAKRWCITPRSVSRIVAREAPHLEPAKRAEINYEKLRRPGSSSPGRPRVLNLPPELRPLYIKLRDGIGVQAAREYLGLAA